MSQLMVFAAGFGKRLQPITLQTPKPLVCIDNTPILKHILKYYQPYCQEPFVVNIHYLKEQFTDFAKKNPQYNICWSFEKEILGSAGGLFFAKEYFQARHFWLHNADTLCNYVPQEMMEFHQSKNAIATLGVRSTPITDSRVQVAKNGEVLGFEKFSNVHSTCYQLKTFCGIHCVCSKIFSLLKGQKIPSDIIELYQILLQKGAKILTWNLEKYHWIDIGNLKNLVFARKNKELFF